MLLMFPLHAIVLLTICAAKKQNDVCEEGSENCNTRTGRIPTTCYTPLPRHWLCLIGHVCCHKRGLTAKRTCSSTAKKCQREGGTCVRSATDSCKTASVAGLCKGKTCTCCLGDHPACDALPRCRLRGGYCYRGKKKLKCPSKQISKKGCGGKHCSCCLVERGCSCGEAVTKNRIVGGQKVRPKNKYPWMVGIQVPSFLNGSYICGGSIINEYYVITAAHCLFNPNSDIQRKPKDLLIGIADHKQFSTKDNIAGVTALVHVKKIIVHENFVDEGRINYDIALLRLKKPLDLLSHSQLKPVCLPTGSTETYEGAIASVYGWGIKNFRTRLQNTLRETTLPILDSNCQDKIIGGAVITPQMLCAGYEKGGKDTCLGDSGGPLTVEEEGRHVLVGITSFGEGCGFAGSPGVYARVTAFLTWIINNTQDATYCN